MTFDISAIRAYTKNFTCSQLWARPVLPAVSRLAQQEVQAFNATIPYSTLKKFNFSLGYLGKYLPSAGITVMRLHQTVSEQPAFGAYVITVQDPSLELLF